MIIGSLLFRVGIWRYGTEQSDSRRGRSSDGRWV